MSKYRVDRANEIAELMDQVRDAYDAAEGVGAPGAPESSFERLRERDAGLYRREPPAHRQKPVSVAQQYTDNLVAAQYTSPEAFGRSRVGQHRVIVKSSEPDGRPMARDEPTPLSIGTGVPGPGRAPAPVGKDVPVWVWQPIGYDDAVRLIEEVGRQAFLRAPTRMAQAKARALPTRDSATEPRRAGRHPDDQFERPFAPPAAPVEITNPNFAWPEGGSYFAQMAAEAVVLSGEGAEFFDPDRTGTYFGRPY